MPQPPDAKFFSLLVKVLYVGSSPQAGEADAAFLKSISMMEDRGVTIDDILNRIRADDLPQPVLAELARRYCLSRPNLTSSGKDEYYRSVFLKIAEMYAPRASVRSASDAEKQQETNNASTQSDEDWVRKMDEARKRQENDARPKSSHSKPEPPPSPSERDRNSARLRWTIPAFSILWNLVLRHFGILSYAARYPLRTTRLVLICGMFGVPPGAIAAVFLGGYLENHQIHALDDLHWSIFLAITSLPFVVIKGVSLCRKGWYTR